jgi:hypothetical protein
MAMNQEQQPSPIRDAAQGGNDPSRHGPVDRCDQELPALSPDHFRDRREKNRLSQEGLERRQFSSNYQKLSPAGAELGKAIDSYKVAHRRRYITYDEILTVLESLGYRRTDSPSAEQSPHPLTSLSLDASGLLAQPRLAGSGFVVTDTDS